MSAFSAISTRSIDYVEHRSLNNVVKNQTVKLVSELEDNEYLTTD